MNGQMVQAFMQFVQNPSAMLQRFGVSPQALSNPQALIQQMLNSGRITQEQYNQASAQARQMQNNPQFMQMIKSTFGR